MSVEGVGAPLLHALAILVLGSLSYLATACMGQRVRLGRLIAWVISTWLLACSIPASREVLAWPLKQLAPLCHPDECPDADVIVVLGGGGHTGKGSRLAMGVELYQRHRARKLLLSGRGFGQVPEAVLLSRAALRAGIPESDIHVENRSMNTIENALYSTMVVREQRYASMLLVSSKIHLARASRAFRCLGMRVSAVGVDWPDIGGRAQWTPSWSSLRRSAHVVKEYVALLMLYMQISCESPIRHAQEL